MPFNRKKLTIKKLTIKELTEEELTEEELTEDDKVSIIEGCCKILQEMHPAHYSDRDKVFRLLEDGLLEVRRDENAKRLSDKGVFEVVSRIFCAVTIAYSTNQLNIRPDHYTINKAVNFYASFSTGASLSSCSQSESLENYSAEMIRFLETICAEAHKEAPPVRLEDIEIAPPENVEHVEHVEHDESPTRKCCCIIM